MSKRHKNNGPAGFHGITWLLRRLRRVQHDERGVIMYYTAIVACVVISLFTLTWDVSRVSEDKIQMQNAVDSAALEMAVWQARGMNMTQHINDEIYEFDKIILVVYTAVAVATAIGIPLRAVYGIGYIIEGVAAPFAYIARLLRFTTVELFLKPLRYVYANGSVVMGYVAANNVATYNKADPILSNVNLEGGGGMGLPGWLSKNLNGLLKNFTAVGIPTTTDMFLTLPLESKETKDLPLNTKKFKPVINLMLKNTFIYPKSYKFWGWNDKYYQSKDPYDSKPLPPMVWIVKKDKTMGLLSSYFLGGVKEPQKIPIIAYSVGQCKGGNVVMYNCYKNEYRPNCFGTGSDAFLVPFDSISDNSAIKALGKLFLH